MSLDERIWFLMLGCFLGFILGYLTRLLRETRTGIRDVKAVVDKSSEDIREHNSHDDSGFIRMHWSFNNVMMIIVVAATVYASFISQRAVNHVQNEQSQIDQSTVCNKHFLGKTIHTLNARTKVSAQNTKANVDLVDSETHFFAILLHNPAYGPDVQAQAATDYFSDLSKFLRVSKHLNHNRKENPFPTLVALLACVHHK